MTQLSNWIGVPDGTTVTVIVSLVAMAAAVAAALVAHRILLSVLLRAVRRTASQTDDILVARLSRPGRWVLIVAAIGLAQRMAPPNAWLAEVWRQAVGLLFPALFGWLAIELVRAVEEVVKNRADISASDNLQARRKRTRASILARIVIVLLIFLTICMMLISIPGVRSVGVTLMASAGLAGLAVAAAAQPALKNLIAGIQLAFTEPIRIDDVVIVDGEWGRIEDIHLTYVVVKVWDERRLVVPISKFLEETFQNWTRESAQLLGSAFLYVDPTAEVPKIRAKLEEVVKAHPLWDGRFFNLQVTDIKPDVMELRVLATASDASRTFDLRCDIREKLMGYVARQMPQALPRRRLEPALDETGAAGPARWRAARRAGDRSLLPPGETDHFGGVQSKAMSRVRWEPPPLSSEQR